MTRIELAQALANETDDLTVAGAEEVLRILPAIMYEELKDNGRFALPQIGSFRVHDTKARKGRNPQTGAPIDIPAGKRIGFRVGAALKSGL